MSGAIWTPQAGFTATSTVLADRGDTVPPLHPSRAEVVVRTAKSSQEQAAVAMGVGRAASRDDLRIDEPLSAGALGTDLTGFMSQESDPGSTLEEITARLDRAANRAVSRAFDFNALRLLVNVGGGDGRQLAAILQAHPVLHGVLYDRPHVLPVARRHLLEAGVLQRSLLVGGNSLTGVPGGADTYLLRSVVRDFDADGATQVLERIRMAIPPKGRLLLIEPIVPHFEGTSTWIGALIDPWSPLMRDRKDLAEEELRALLASADFELRRTVPTATPHAFVEAIPV
jgi:C-methyltransferase